MSVVLKFPLDRVPRANEVNKNKELNCAQIIVFEGVRYSRTELGANEEPSNDSKPAKPC